MATKTYTVPEFRQKLAKHVQDLIQKHAPDIRELWERETRLNKSSPLDAAPGNAEPGAQAHIEPGGDEQFTVTPPQDPQLAQDPIGQGPTIPSGQVGDGQQPNGNDMCPLCGHPDVPGQCTCLSGMAKSDGYDTGPGDAASMGAGGPASAAPATASTGGDSSFQMSEANPGANKDPSKAQPTKPVAGACLPPESPKKVKGPDDNKPKKNALGKTDVPTAKPPSGKVPGQGQAPVASNVSKPGVTKNDEELNKGALPAAPKAQMQQHALVDASKAAAGKPAGGAAAAMAPAAGAKLTHPADMSRANMFQAAAAGAFQPPAASKPAAPGLALKPPAPGLKEVKSGVGAGPKPAPAAAGALPKPTFKPPAMPAAGSLPSHGPFGKSEKCAFCGKSEHRGRCSAPTK